MTDGDSCCIAVAAKNIFSATPLSLHLYLTKRHSPLPSLSALSVTLFVFRCTSLSLFLFLLSFRFNPSSLWRYFSYLRILVTDFVSLCLDRVIDIRVSVFEFVTPDSWASMINLACFACQLHRMFCRGRCRFNEPRSK